MWTKGLTRYFNEDLSHKVDIVFSLPEVFILLCFFFTSIFLVILRRIGRSQSREPPSQFFSKLNSGYFQSLNFLHYHNQCLNHDPTKFSKYYWHEKLNLSFYEPFSTSCIFTKKNIYPELQLTHYQARPWGCATCTTAQGPTKISFNSYGCDWLWGPFFYRSGAHHLYMTILKRAQIAIYIYIFIKEGPITHMKDICSKKSQKYKAFVSLNGFPWSQP